MELIKEILSEENMQEALKRVKSNKGVAGIDKITVNEIDEYYKENISEIKSQIYNMTYKPMPVRRVYIPKSNGKKRPLGIPVVMDRVIQQAIAQVISPIYEMVFSEHSHGFRPMRSCHSAMEEVVAYVNEGYEWIVDLDIEKFFDKVHHDKLISILREQVKDKRTLHLIRAYLKAGIMEDNNLRESLEGVPQGGPLSPLLANIYLDKFDKELESRGLRFVRYADDCNIFVKSEKAANRVKESVISWLERKLFLKANEEKTKVVRNTKSEFLGFTFYKNSTTWKLKPTKSKKRTLREKVKIILKRNKAVARSIGETFQRLNYLMRGWINYFKIGSMKNFLDEFGQWLRHKVRVIILKQWKRPRRIYLNLQKLNRYLKAGFTHEDIFKVANSRLGWYRRSSYNVVNFLISPKILAKRKESRPGLVDPLQYYLANQL